jgi:hypothetical protein
LQRKVPGVHHPEEERIGQQLAEGVVRGGAGEGEAQWHVDGRTRFAFNEWKSVEKDG